MLEVHIFPLSFGRSPRLNLGYTLLSNFLVTGGLLTRASSAGGTVTLTAFLFYYYFFLCTCHLQSQKECMGGGGSVPEMDGNMTWPVPREEIRDGSLDISCLFIMW